MARIRERRPGVWEITISLPRDPVTGRYQQRSTYVHTGATTPHTGKNPPRIVQRRANELETEAGNAKTQATVATVATLFDAYLHHQEKRGRAAKTMLEYRRFAEKIGEELGQVPLAKLTAAHLDDLQLRLKARGLSDTSRHHYHAFISQALNQAVRWEWIPRNPAQSAEAPSLRPVERTPPSPDEIKLLLTSVAEKRPDLGALILVAATTGCRRGELCGLRWRDVDLDKAEIHVRQAITDLPNRLGGVQAKDTKTHRPRVLAIDDLTIAVLLALEERTKAVCAKLGVELGPDCYVWSQEPEHTVPWKPNRVTMTFAAARHAVGLDHIQLKDLRAWSATQLLSGGIDVRNTAGRLGHSPQVLLKTYAHRLPARDQAGARILGALLSAG